MAAAAIKVASAAQGNKHSNKKHNHNPNYVAPDPNDDGESKEDEKKGSAEEIVFATEGFFKYQRQAREFYTDTRIEVFVAFLIGANFLTNIVEKTIDPRYGSRGLTEKWCYEEGNTEAGYCEKMIQQEQVWWGFALFYNIAFTIELVVNMYGLQGGYAFWKSSWNVFDFVVVSIGVLGYMPITLPGPFALLRMMRAFRVFRLFKRVKSLNKILVSLARAVPGVMNAFLIMLIVMCIYAILGVEFYKYEGTRCHDFLVSLGYDVHDVSKRRVDLGDDCYLRGDGFQLPSADDDVTQMAQIMQQTFGYVYFGNFMKSLYSLFQVLTGDSWSEAIGRPLMEMNWYSTMYFVSFILLNAVVLINVVVAVLLEKMVDETPEPSDEDDYGDEEILSTEERLEKVEERTDHIHAMLAKLLEAQHIPIPPKPQKLSSAAGPQSPAALPPSALPAETEVTVTTLTKDSGGGPSRVDYTDPKDSGLLHDDELSVSSVSTPTGGSESADPGCSMQILGCA
jgi:hypothetical protein